MSRDVSGYQEIFKPRGSSGIGSGRVRRCLKYNRTGRVGLGQEVFRSRGSGRVVSLTPHLTREKPCLFSEVSFVTFEDL